MKVWMQQRKDMKTTFIKFYPPKLSQHFQLIIISKIIIKFNNFVSNLSRPDIGQKEKINFYFKKTFIFTVLCGASKALMKALKVFIKPYEAPQRSV